MAGVFKKEIMFKRIKYWITCDRLGPDIPLTHFLLHFPLTMRWICKKKFKNFGEMLSLDLERTLIIAVKFRLVIKLLLG